MIYHKHDNFGKNNRIVNVEQLLMELLPHKTEHLKSLCFTKGQMHWSMKARTFHRQ